MAVLCPNCQKQYDVTLFQFGQGIICDCGTEVNPFTGAAVDQPIDGVLDLHTFLPAEVKELVPDYLEECLRKEIYRVRIIHGRGSGALLRTVHAILSRLPEVESFALAGEEEGGWGATIVRLRRGAPQL